MADTPIILVTFHGERESVPCVKQAVEWIISKPEGKAVLRDALALHGKPLQIVVDSTASEIGYGPQGKHVVILNPKLLEKLFMRGENGEAIQSSLERFLCHEFKHASQKGLLEHEAEYTARSERITEECMPSVPEHVYAKRIQAAAKPEDIKRILSEIYDAHIGPGMAKATEEMNRKAAADPVIRHVIDNYEMPTMQFENLMMTKYKNEPARKLDYLGSDIREGAIGKEIWIESNCASILAYRQVVAAQERIGGKDPKAIRADAGAKPGGETELG